MAKKFERKYMHDTRRKLVDMIKTGVYESSPTFGYVSKEEVRAIGDIWEDEHHRYEKHDGFTMKTSKNSDAFQEIRDYVKQSYECKGTDCKTTTKTAVDKKLIKRTGYCITCLAEIEQKIKLAGIWVEYQNYKIWTRMIVDGKLRLEQIKQAYDDVKQEYEYINEDGSRDKWVMPQPVEEVKAEMLELITNGTREIEEIEALRLEAFNVIKNIGYEHYL